MRIGFDKAHYTRALLSLALLTAPACERSGSAGAPATVRDSAGVRIVELPGLAGVERPRVLRMDTTWAPSGVLQSGELVDLAVAPDGRIFLLDRLGPRVGVLSPYGEWIGGFGRKGEGPGELSSGGLRRLVLTDSSVLIPDLFQQRVTEFDHEGRILDIRSFPSPGYALDWRGHPEGGLAYRLLRQAGDLILHWHGDALDTLYTFQPMGARPNLVLSPAALWDVGLDGSLITGRSDQGWIRREGDDAGWIMRSPQPPSELGDGERAHLEEILMQTVREANPGEISEEGLRQVSYPEHTPLLSGLMWTPGGDVWIRLAADVEDMGREALRVGTADGYGGTTWILLGPDGLPRERVELPAGFTPLQFVGEWLYGIGTTAMDVRHPARVRW